MGGAPPVDPAMMDSAAAQGVPMPVPAPPMEMTAAEYENSEKPEKNRVGHMLLNLKSRR